MALAGEMTAGLAANPTVYPAPPVTIVDLGTAMSDYRAAREAAGAEAAAAEQATTTKEEALEALTDAMRADLRYAENTVDFDDDKLKLLGWGGRKAGTSLEPPASPGR